MISGEKEKVRFYKSINVNEGEKKGNVERWLKVHAVHLRAQLASPMIPSAKSAMGSGCLSPS